MKEGWNWKKFMALFMAVAMVMASGIFVTTQSFKAGEDEEYESDVDEEYDEVEDFEEEDYEEEEVELDDEEDFDEESEDEESVDEDMDLDEESEDVESEDVEDELDEEGSDEESLSDEDMSEEEAEEESEEEPSEEISVEETVEEEGEGAQEEAGEITGSVKITFNLNGVQGEAPNEMTASRFADGDLDDVELPELDDWTDSEGKVYSFKGWSAEEDATEPDEELGTEDGEEELELFAVWEVSDAVDQAAESADGQAAEETAQEEQAEEQDAEAQAKAALDEAKSAQRIDEEGYYLGPDGMRIKDENGEWILADASDKKEDKEEQAAEEEKAKAEEEAAAEEEAKAEEEAAAEEEAKAEEEAAAQAGQNVDEEGYLIDENGNRLLDEDGNPIKADGAQAPEDKQVIRRDEDGYLLDENGQRVLDEDGNPIRIDEDGYLVDEDGNRILDKDGNPIKATGLEDAVSASLLAKAAADAAAEEAAQYLPEGFFADSTPKGINVRIGYGEKVFPAGTTMVVKDVSDEEALALAQEVDENMAEAVAVDISFYNAQGEEIQPEGRVDVSITAPQTIAAENPTLIHVPDSGAPEEIKRADVDANSAEFSTSEFSKFVLAGVYVSYEDAADRTYEYNGNACDTLTLRSGYILVTYRTLSNGDKDIQKQEYLAGVWKVEDDGGVIKAKDNQQYEWEFDSSGPVFDIVTTGKAGDGVVTFTATAPSGEIFVATHIIHVKGYTAHFDANGGQGSIPDVQVTMGAKNSTLIQMPKGEELSREGYKLVGWSTNPDEMSKGINAQYMTPDDGNEGTTDDTYSMAIDENTQDITFYAMWAEDVAVKGKVGFYIRKDGIIQTEPRGYPTSDYHTMVEIDTEDLREYITYVKVETNLDQVKKNITQTAWDAVNAANESKKIWNPDTEYVQWYVIKKHEHWHVDGVVRQLSDCNLDYHTNCKNYSGACPPSKQYPAGTEVTVGGEEAYTLTRTGYEFGGWNTEPDGSGIGYQDGAKLVIKKNTDLYAMWIPYASTPYVLNCYDADTDELISDATKYRVGTTGNSIKANDNDKKLRGYVFDEGNPKNVLEAIVAEDGKTELKLYFKKVLDVQVNLTDVSKVYDKEPVEVGVVNVTVNGEEAKASYKDNTLSFTYDGKTY
ncbi:MAG: InlB B-repeat-containing protein, partial [Lachnospiraceae bacterium]|nr:InlB B-repeat-containing protein [Lachnospiraceae bacterium]